MIFVFINKRNWRHPGPIVTVGIHNAHSVAALRYETHFCVGEGEPSETESDLRSFYGLEPCSTLQIHRVKRQKIGNSTTSLSIFLYAHQLIHEVVRRDRVAVLTREGSFLPFLAWIARHPRIRCFFEAHDFFPDLSWRKESSSFQDWKLCWFERLLLPRITGLIAIVEPQAALYRARFPHLRVNTLPLGTKHSSPGDPDARFALRRAAYTGHLHTSKGVRDILDAVACPEDHLSAVFFGGSEQQIEKFGKIAASKGCQDVKFFTFRPPHEVHGDLENQVSVGLVVLLDDYYNARLTCPVKALDYLSHGLPVIASDLPTTRDVLGDSAIYIPPGDSAALRAALLHLLGDLNEYRRRSQLSWERATELDWSRRARRLVDWVSAN